MSGEVSNPLLNRGYLSAVLSQNSISLTAQRGQNFLVDKGVLNRVISAARIDPEDMVLEIGSGLGTMTAYLRTRARVFAVEYDHGLARLFPSYCPLGPDLHLEEGDFIKLDLRRILDFAQGAFINVVSNLPYSITGAALMKLISSPLQIRRMTCMVQEEVAHRLVSPPGTKSYGFFSAMVQIYTKPEILFKVSRKSFFPVPRVDSAVVGFEMRPLVDEKPSRAQVRQIISAAFSQRRKMIKNTLERSPALGYTSESVLAGCRQAGIDPQIRPEQVTPEQFFKLAGALGKGEKDE